MLIFKNKQKVFSFLEQVSQQNKEVKLYTVTSPYATKQGETVGGQREIVQPEGEWLSYFSLYENNGTKKIQTTKGANLEGGEDNTLNIGFWDRYEGDFMIEELEQTGSTVEAPNTTLAGLNLTEYFRGVEVTETKQETPEEYNAEIVELTEEELDEEHKEALEEYKADTDKKFIDLPILLSEEESKEILEELKDNMEVEVGDDLDLYIISSLGDLTVKGTVLGTGYPLDIVSIKVAGTEIKIENDEEIGLVFNWFNNTKTKKQEEIQRQQNEDKKTKLQKLLDVGFTIEELKELVKE